jgi:hypothetical protein
MSNAPAKALPAPRTGNAALDAALSTIQTSFDGETAEVKKAFSFVMKLGAGDKGKLVGLFVPPSWDFGGSGEWDDARAKKLKPAERTAYKAAHDAAYAAHTRREQYYKWLLARLVESREGCNRLVELARDKKTPDHVRSDAVKELRRSMNPSVIDALVSALPPRTWSPLKGPVLGVLTAAAEAQLRKDRKRALADIAPMLTGKKADPIIAEAVLTAVDAASRPPGTTRFGVRPKDKVAPDQAWADVALRFLDVDDLALAEQALLVLIGVRPDAGWRELVEHCLSERYTGNSQRLADELLEALPKAKPSADKKAAAKKPEGPLPPEKRGRAPKPRHPAYEPVAKLRKRLDAMLAKAGLGKHAGVLIDPAIHLLTTRTDEAKLPLGGTKIGGLPELPPGAKWPTQSGVPLAFVAQLRLEDVKKLGEKRLPEKGLLSFFIDDEAEDYPGKVLVVHTKDPKKLERLEPPPSFQARRAGRPARQPFAACTVKMVPTLTVPSSSNPVVTKLGAKAAEAYEEHVALEQPEVPQLLGFRFHGYDAENPATARLLLRVSSDDQADMGWGDNDCLDLYIPRKDLEKGSFAKVYPYIGD